MKIAVVGNGIVGASFVNEITERFPDYQIVQFDETKGNATIASAGIIAPWLSKRRNQRWYTLARKGAEYLSEIASKYDMPEDVYFKSGVIYTRDTDAKIEELMTLAAERIKDAPQMEEFRKVTAQEIKKSFNFIDSKDDGIFVQGGARIDGKKFVDFLNYQKQDDFELRKIQAKITRNEKNVFVNDERFDLVVLTAGAWLKETLQNIDIEMLTRPQKGQLIEVSLPNNTKINHDAPVLMPEGERDFIPTNHGTLLIGATHENDQGFDLKISNQIMDDLLASGQRLIPGLEKTMVQDVRVGTRAYTNDFSPFFGFLPNQSQIMVASGLGSSGLTTGPIIGKKLVDLIENPNLDVSNLTKPVDTYIK